MPKQIMWVACKYFVTSIETCIFGQSSASYSTPLYSGEHVILKHQCKQGWKGYMMVLELLSNSSTPAMRSCRRKILLCIKPTMI